VPASSQPPPSEKIPGKSGSGAPYVLGILVLGILAVGLFCWKSKHTPATVTAQSASAPPVSAAPPPQLPQFAPPPPPPIDEPDAGADPSKSTAKGAAPVGTGSPAGAGVCARCTEGNPSAALSASLRSRAQSAQGCYKRALRNSEVSGSMTVSVQVGSTGSVCSAAIVNDSVHSSDVSSCVLGRFRGQTFPPPTSGCVTVNIPISFTVAVKQ